MDLTGHSKAQDLKLAVIIPTFNERDNIVPLIKKLDHTLAGIPFELVFVDDDSPDGTAELIRAISLQDPRVRVLHRIGRRGLASACLEGMMATAAPVLAVMDADMQHDETILPKMLAELEAKNLDLVIGSRNVEGGSMGEFTKERVALSQLGRRLSALVSHCEMSDPMSGFFMLQRGFLEQVVHQASGTGFKILLDLVASAPRPVRLGEVGYTFRNRMHGESKLDISVGLEYIYLLLDKSIGHLIPVRFVLFTLVGLVGWVLYVALLGLLFQTLGYSFTTAVIAASFVAMTLNFAMNNLITFRNQRLRGWAWLGGLIFFYIACGIGVASNLSVASLLLSAGLPWMIAGSFGLVVSSVWNYGVSSVFAWRIHQSKKRAVIRK